MQLKKKFILVGPILLLGHSKIFPLYRDGKIRMGVTRPCYFINPDGSRNSSGASIWITNIPIARKWPSIEYCRDPLSSYTVGICKDGRGYPYIENHRRIPDTARPILVPTSSLRYFNPSEWMFLSTETVLYGERRETNPVPQDTRKEAVPITHEDMRRLVDGVKGSDEYYTRYEDIDRELKHYAKQIAGKKIYLPCDSGRSMFVKWFREHPELRCRVVNTSDD